MCGVHHSHIPTVVEAVSPEDFYDWVEMVRERDKELVSGCKEDTSYFSGILDRVIPVAACESSGGVFVDRDARYEFINKVFCVRMVVFKKVGKLKGGLDPGVACEVDNIMERCQKFYYLTSGYLGNYLYLSRGSRTKCSEMDEGIVVVRKSLDVYYKSGLKFFNDVLNRGKIRGEQRKEIEGLIEE